MGRVKKNWTGGHWPPSETASEPTADDRSQTPVENSSLPLSERLSSTRVTSPLSDRLFASLDENSHKKARKDLEGLLSSMIGTPNHPLANVIVDVAECPLNPSCGLESSSDESDLEDEFVDWPLQADQFARNASVEDRCGSCQQQVFCE